MKNESENDIRTLDLKCPACWRVITYEIESINQNHVICSYCNTTFAIDSSKNRNAT